MNEETDIQKLKDEETVRAQRLVIRQGEAKKKRAEERLDRAWADLGNTLYEMGKGDDLGPLGQERWDQ